MNCAQKLNFDNCARENKENMTEHSDETSGCETSDSFGFHECLSPIQGHVARKLDFSKMEDEENEQESNRRRGGMSPPYNRVKALRLFDSPSGPKTVHSTPSYHPTRSRILPPRFCFNNRSLTGSNQSLNCPVISDDSALDSLPADQECVVGSSEHLELSRLRRAPVSINPFTPDGQRLNSKKRSKTPSPWSSTTPEHPAKRLKESNISRYKKEFIEECVIGTGQFGRVYKCLHALDGVTYAVKKSLKPIASTVSEKAALNEIYAHAVLGSHPNVVRYYSSWAEDDHMIIQNEYCNGGSLQQLVGKEGPLPQSELVVVLHHVARGLRFIHSKKLVHMDIKPANILICLVDKSEYFSSDQSELSSEGSDSEDECRALQIANVRRIYKLGDLGHVTCISAPSTEEGDCRYIPTELLADDYDHLKRADIFALGLTLYEAGGGGPLPKNGDEWHKIRNGGLPDLKHCTPEFNQLLKNMVSKDVNERPSAHRLCRIVRQLCTVDGDGRPDSNERRRLSYTMNSTDSFMSTCEPTREQMEQMLHAARMQNQILARHLHEAAKCIKTLASGKARKRRSGSIMQKNIADVLHNVTASIQQQQQT